MPVVDVKNLVKRYGNLLALDHFNLQIEPGEVFGLLGPNGSGKTTTVNCILQLLAYDKGEISLFGEPMAPNRYDLKRRVGVVPQDDAMLRVLCDNGPHNLSEILSTLQERGTAFGRVYSEPPTLNDVFLEITGKQLRD